MSKPRLVIHIGPMKTGTTAIGVYFSDATKAGILPANVVYPCDDLWFPSGGRVTKHNVLGADFLGEKARWAEGRKIESRTPAEIEAKVKAAAEHAAGLGVKNPTVVFVSETIANREKSPNLIEMLKKYFGDITLVIAVRSPIAASSSLLVHRVKDWRVDQYDLDLYQRLVDEGTGAGFNYERILDRWLAYPGVSVELIPYFEDESDGYAVVDRLMRIVSGTDAPRLADDFGQRRIHPSLPLKSLERLIALKKLNLRWSKVPGATTIIKRAFNRVLLGDRHKAVRAGLGARSVEHGDWVLSPAERAKVMGIYASSFAAIRKALGKRATTAEWKRWFEAEGL